MGLEGRRKRNWTDWSCAQSEEENASGWEWKYNGDPPIPKVESEGVAGPASWEMEVESKKEPESEAEEA